MLRPIALLAADEPEFGRAASRALLSDDPAVEILRRQTSGAIRRLIAGAAGVAVDSDLVDLLEVVYTGAVVRAGTGHLSYDQVADTVERAARRLLAGSADLPR